MYPAHPTWIGPLQPHHWQAATFTRRLIPQQAGRSGSQMAITPGQKTRKLPSGTPQTPIHEKPGLVESQLPIGPTQGRRSWPTPCGHTVIKSDPPTGVEEPPRHPMPDLEVHQRRRGCAKTFMFVGSSRFGAGSDPRENWRLAPLPRSVDLARAGSPEPGSVVGQCPAGCRVHGGSLHEALSCSLGAADPIGETCSAGVGAWRQATYRGRVTQPPDFCRRGGCTLGVDDGSQDGPDHPGCVTVSGHASWDGKTERASGS